MVHGFGLWILATCVFDPDLSLGLALGYAIMWLCEWTISKSCVFLLSYIPIIPFCSVCDTTSIISMWMCIVRAFSFFLPPCRHGFHTKPVFCKYVVLMERKKEKKKEKRPMTPAFQ